MKLRLSMLVTVLSLSAMALAGEPKDAKIKRALTAAPPSIANDARIADMDEHGNMTVLRDGSNGLRCGVLRLQHPRRRLAVA